jgi:hypothetical protein
MKHLIFLMIAFCTILSMRAQESTTDYIYSGDGFEVKKVVLQSEFVDIGGSSHKSGYCYGLYSKDGKILVSAISSSIYFVLDGCETICSQAFQDLSGARIFIPSSVKYIAPDAICSGDKRTSWNTNFFYGILDGCIEEMSNSSSSSNVPKLDSDVTEVARYNIQGIRITEPSSGINIIQKSDGTAEKVMVK